MRCQNRVPLGALYLCVCWPHAPCKSSIGLGSKLLCSCRAAEGEAEGGRCFFGNVEQTPWLEHAAGPMSLEGQSVPVVSFSAALWWLGADQRLSALQAQPQATLLWGTMLPPR
ncbi:Hypothetical predicted protein [Podarcis lilfordi]|uniref:Uncharacterized protein n=1 Tax=Podarcis lilfordi TaxID=74358 RepID=A0AA35PMH2_9SAUR|nr:Hypothetical predicted protein [Podarcis lilfordi]